MTEAELQDAVIECARLLRWRVFHVRPGKTNQGWRTPVSYDGKGFPDAVFVRDRTFFCEFKSARGKTSPEQEAWSQTLSTAGAEVYLWRPADWLDGTVEEVLRRGR